MAQQIIGFLTILFVLVCVCFLAYVVTKFVGKRTMGGMKSKYMKVIDTLAMGFDRTIYLVRVGKQYVLMYSSTKGFEFICNVDPSMIDENSFESANNVSNGSSFSKYFEFFKPSKEGNVTTKEDNKVNKNIEKLRDLFNNKRD